jgi:Cu(I)/Ag(I) efflux system membrane fusion protein
MRLKPGIAAKVELQSLPGEVFAGEVNYIYPTLDEVSRTARVRVELGNGAGLLRPGMYGNVRLEGVSRDALSVPSESVIATGIRKVVIVRQVSGFMPVTVETGQEHDGRTEILAGLDAGETVVTSGQFLIDSEASLSGMLVRLAQQPAAVTEMDAEDEHAGHAMSDMATEQPMPEGTGKVIELDVKTGKVVLAHDPIAALDWPSMTMEFRVSDPQQLHGITAGDQVQFSLKRDSQSGQYDIAHIRRQGGAQ